MRHGFLDETGDVNPFSGSRFLVIAVLIGRKPRTIEQHIKRAHKRLRRKPKSGEMKASTSDEAVVERLLRSLASEEIAIVAVVVKKRVIVRPLSDPEEMYRLAEPYDTVLSDGRASRSTWINAIRLRPYVTG